MAKLNFDKTKAKRIALNVFYPLLALALALAAWAVWAAVKDMPYLVPMPATVLKRFFSLGGSGEFWIDVLATIGRSVGCFALSFALALLLATLGGLCKPLHRVVSPIVSILRAAPTVAVIFILYAFMAKDSMSVVVGFLIAFPALYSSFYSAIEGVDRDLLDMAKLYKVRARDRVLSIYLPSIAPTLFDSSRSTLSLTLKVVIAAEILTSIPKSMGRNIQFAYASFDISALFAWTLIAIVFSFVLEAAVGGLKKLWEATR